MKMDATRRVLLQFISRGITSNEEIAQLLNTSRSRVYKIMELEDKHFYDYEIRTLSEYFSSLNHNELASQFKSEKFGFIPIGDIKINGSLEDESAEAVKIMGKLLQLFEQKDKEQGLALCDQLLTVVKQKKAEFRNLS